MNKGKHAFAVHFEEHCICLSESDKPSPERMLLLGEELLPAKLLPCSVDLSDHAYPASSPLQVVVKLPPKGLHIGLQAPFDSYHNLPYLVEFFLVQVSLVF